MKIQFTGKCSIQAEASGGLEKGTIVMQPAYSGGPLALNGWDYPCVVEVASIRAAAPLIPCRVGHGQHETDVLGQIAVSLASGNVNAAGRVTNRESPGPRAVLSMAAAGHQFQASIGGEPARKDFVPPGREIEMNGQTFVARSTPVTTRRSEKSPWFRLARTRPPAPRLRPRPQRTSRYGRREENERMKSPISADFARPPASNPATMSDKQKASMADIHAKLCAGDRAADPRRQEGRRKRRPKKETKRPRPPAGQTSIQANSITTRSRRRGVRQAVPADRRDPSRLQRPCGHLAAARDGQDGTTTASRTRSS